MTTNVSVVMMSLNEEGEITKCLSSAEPMFDELVLIDGGSTDDTVMLAENWCELNGKDFKLLESTERELLLEGWGCQRRRGENLVTNDYTFALDCDERVVIENEDWFNREFNYNAYVHTRERTSGQVSSDYRFYRPNPPMDIDEDKVPKWRGMIYEQIMTREGQHVGRFYELAEAPFKVVRQRTAASETYSIHGRRKHTHEYKLGGYSRESQKKQHYLLEVSMHSSHIRYISPMVRNYYHENQGIIKEDWLEIREEYELPESGYGYADQNNEDKNNDEYLHYGFDGEYPIMGSDQLSWSDFVVGKAKKMMGAD